MNLDSKIENFVCPNCGSDEGHAEHSKISTATSKFLGLENRKARTPMACNGCGHVVWKAADNPHSKVLQPKAT